MKPSLKKAAPFFLVVMCCLTATVILAGRLWRSYQPYLDQEIAGPTTTAREWLEIIPKQPLEVERQLHMVVLDLGDLAEKEPDGLGLMLADGTVVKAQVELVADDGSTYELNDPSFFLSDTGDTLAKFSNRELPKEKKYLKVRIRSDKPISCKRVFWRNYNQWDVS